MPKTLPPHSTPRSATPAVTPPSSPTSPLVNGFAGDNKSASREVQVDGKTLRITIHFPAGCTKAERDQRLNQYTVASLTTVGKQAVILGLGTRKAKTNRTIDAITFKHDKGQLEMERKYSDGSTKKSINAQFFNEKLLTKPKNKTKYREQLEALTIVQNTLNFTPTKSTNAAGSATVVEDTRAKKRQNLPLAAAPQARMSLGVYNSIKGRLKNFVNPTQGTKPDTIAFYKTNFTAFLGNFFPAKIDLSDTFLTDPNDKDFGNIAPYIPEEGYQCAEAAFQHIKWLLTLQENNIELDDEPLLNKFATANGQEAFDLNEKLKTLYSNRKAPEKAITAPAKAWTEDNGLRNQAMWEILKVKFSDLQLLKLLQLTGNTFLIEHNNKKGKDDFWSNNNDEPGCFHITTDGKCEYKFGKSNGLAGNVLGLFLMAIRAGAEEMPEITPTHLMKTKSKNGDAKAVATANNIFT